MQGETVKKLHVYANGVVDWFVAESLDDAKVVAAQYFDDCGTPEDERDFDLEQEPDDKPLRIYNEFAPRDAADPFITDTCAAWAKQNGRGFLCSTEW